MRRLGFLMALLSGLWIPVGAVSDAGFVPLQDQPVLDPSQAPVVQQKAATGVIEEKDAVKSLIQLKDEVGRHLAFRIGTNTPIYNEGRRQIAFDSLQPGDIVTVQYVADNQTVREVRKLDENLPAANQPPAY